MTRIEIEPTKRTEHRQYYRVWLGTEVLIENTWCPEFAAARESLARGVVGRLETRMVGAPDPSLQLDIEKAAGLTVEEADRTGPKFAKWKPHPEETAEHAFPARPARRGRPIAIAPVPRGLDE